MHREPSLLHTTSSYRIRAPGHCRAYAVGRRKEVFLRRLVFSILHGVKEHALHRSSSMRSPEPISSESRIGAGEGPGCLVLRSSATRAEIGLLMENGKESMEEWFTKTMSEGVGE